MKRIFSVIFALVMAIAPVMAQEEATWQGWH